MLISPKRNADLVPNAPAGMLRFFIDIDGQPCTKDENGTVNVLRGPQGVGVPPGGTAGQVAAKVDETDYNVEWIDPPEGGGGGGGAGAVTKLTASSVSGELAFDTSVNGVYIVDIDTVVTDLSFSALPADGVTTEVIIVFNMGGYPSYWEMVPFPPDWNWRNGLAPEPVSSRPWKTACVRLTVIGDASNPTISSEFYTLNRPEWRPRVRNYNGQASVDAGVATCDLSTGDMFWIDVDQEITDVRFSNWPGDKLPDGSYSGQNGRTIAVDIFFYRAADPFDHPVNLPDGYWDNGVKYEVPTGENVTCRVHMVLDGTEDVDNGGPPYVELGYGVLVADTTPVEP